MSNSQFYLVLWSVLAFWGLGQIWLTQIVVYPLFAKAGESDYLTYHRYYTSRIPLVVILPGFAIFLLPFLLGYFGPQVPQWMTLANITCGMIGLAVTLILEIPRHNRLEKQRDENVIRELIAFNWPRTASITGQAAVTFAMLMHVFDPVH